jgi:uncharacterized membrane protein YbhN (UPF0104 family)
MMLRTTGVEGPLDLKKYLLAILKTAVPLAIIVWLLSTIDRDQLWQLQQRPKDWWRLAAAFSFCLTAIAITFMRWYLLVRTLHLKFRLTDAFRLGSLGYLLNFISAGSVGGDLFKAVFLARDQPGNRTEAIASVVMDRLVGFYALLVVASMAILIGTHSPLPAIDAVCKSTLAVTAAGTLGIAVALLPGFMTGPFAEFLTGLPRIGGIFNRLIAAVRMYRGQPWAMLGIFAMAITVHVLLCISLYLVSTGLGKNVPSLGEHFVIVPLSGVAGGLPFTPAGLGTYEFAMDVLFKQVPIQRTSDVPGVLVALAYRLITIAVAAVGVVYYWISRAEIRDVMRQAEHVQATT